MSLRDNGRNYPGSGSTRSIVSTPRTAPPRCPISSAAAPNSSSTTSCLAPIILPAAPACSAIADGFNGIHVHLANHDVMLWAVSRAPLAKLQSYKQRMGWTFPWASSFGTDFNYDFGSSYTEEQEREGVEYNYRREKPYQPPTDPESGAVMFARMSGTDHATYTREAPGMSAFALEDGVVYHTYSAYARGLDSLWSMYQWLDRAPKGRNEESLWFRRHDEY